MDANATSPAAARQRPTGPVPVPQLVVEDLRTEWFDGVVAISAWMRGGPAGDGLRVRFRLHGAGVLDPTATAFVPVAAVAASWAGSDVVIDAPVDAVALAGARRAITLLAGFGSDAGASVPSITASEVIADTRVIPAQVTPSGDAVGSDHALDARDRHQVGLFFTRGVDSAATLLADADTVTHLIGIDWVDPPYCTPGTEAVFASTRMAAAERGLPLLRVTSNVRDLLDAGPGWRWAFGPVLASFGLAVAPMLSEVRISSAFGPGDPTANSSQELLDPWWSSSQVAIVHRTATRLDRTAAVAGDPWAMRWLKVCWMRSGDGNCGRCPKCLMTMTALYICGAGDRVAGCFEAPLSADAVWSSTQVPRVSALPIMQELVGSLHPDDPLRHAWEGAVLAAKQAMEAEKAIGAAPDTPGWE